jgi:hypothetical protein
VKERLAEFKAWLADAEKAAHELEQVLRSGAKAQKAYSVAADAA